jgi:ribosome-associated heat shock protein Hsp15
VTTRVDAWLWAVRIYKTRTAATDACRGGHVRINGKPTKPATSVQVGDRVEATLGPRLRDLEVVRLLDKRVGAAVAVAAYVDHSPPPPPKELDAPTFLRDRGAGRPTKRERRALDRVTRRR